MSEPIKQEEELDEQIEQVQTVKAKTAKEMKAMYRPIFRKTPQNYYPTKVFSKFGYTRAECKCGSIYWRRTEKRDTCGDSECVGSYTFIGKGFGQGAKGQKITYAEAWKKYSESMSKQEVPSVPVDRYPVVARWRNDVDYVAAGIFCYQPYCVTGELDPPANPLVQAQFCLRFNDLDNVGVSGRHYSGFVMLGNQVFNKPENYVYFDEECVEYHLNWLLSMDCDLDEVTLIEDVWSGGGNLGSSIELFAHGMEIGNMVFTRYKYFPSGEIEELDVKVIDVGIGMERIPWLINGSATSYDDVFEDSLQFLREKIQLKQDDEAWGKFGPYACLLNVDEAEDIKKTWEHIAGKCDMTLEELQSRIFPQRDLFKVCDHTRTIFMAIYDGSLPSNVGGGSNIRNIIRTTFSLLKKNGWFEKIGGIEGYIELLDKHRTDLQKLYGTFQPYKSFEEIIKKEYNSWITTDADSKKKLDSMLKKSKTLTLNDWILAVTSYGIPADQIAEITKTPIPSNFWYALAEGQEKVAKAQEAILYSTAHLKETNNLYYLDHKQYKFETKIQEIFKNVTQKNQRNIVIFEDSGFYPTSGGQLHDTGKFTIGSETYNIINVIKVRKSVLHIIDRELENSDDDQYIGKTIQAEIDEERRSILRNHHTATHLMFAACRKVLGPHVWQNGAKKTTVSAHLDITHYQSLTKEIELEIENTANKLILENHTINKGIVDKAEAEKQHGFRLYQGGIVPGNKLRVVNIENTDVEACCGTHCDQTSEVGWIKLLKTSRIQDGIVRLYFVAGIKCMDKLNFQTSVINDLSKMWGVNQNTIVNTAQDFFNRTKKAEKEVDEQSIIILNQRMELQELKKTPLMFYKAMEYEPKFYMAYMKNFIKSQKENNLGTIFIGKLKPDGDRFIFGQFGDASVFNSQEFLQQLVVKGQENPTFKKSVNKMSYKEGKKNVNVENCLQFFFVGKFNENQVYKYLQDKGYVLGM